MIQIRIIAKFRVRLDLHKLKWKARAFPNDSQIIVVPPQLEHFILKNLTIHFSETRTPLLDSWGSFH